MVFVRLEASIANMNTMEITELNFLCGIVPLTGWRTDYIKLFGESRLKIWQKFVPAPVVCFLNGEKTPIPVNTKREASYSDIIVAAGYKPDDIITVIIRSPGGISRSLSPTQKPFPVCDESVIHAMYTGNA